MSSPEMTDAPAVTAERAASAILGAPTESITIVRGGRNSRVYRVSAGGTDYALKQYFRHPGDTRDRMQTEFAALKFMREGGIAAIPRPLGFTADPECALYEWIEGTRPSPSSVTGEDIDRVVLFLASLRALARDRTGAWTAPASEARLAISGIVENLEQRLDALRRTSAQGANRVAFNAFLTGSLEPSVKRIVQWSRDAAEAERSDYAREISLRERTLSPSDCGFHNALRRSDGEIIFLDFEYFGWDDPAKMVSDFLLHPAMPLPDERKIRFVRGVLGAMDDVPRLAERVGILYPLFGLKWVIILLNEFLPEHLLRRDFAGAADGTHEELQRAQLEKARRLLEDILADYERFPYT